MVDRVDQLIRLSRQVGADPLQVLAGGGNSSVKTNGTMWVKASGTVMATMTPEDLVEVELDAVLAIPTCDEFSEDRDEKENQIARLLLDARVDPKHPDLRPSVETILHALMPQRFVLHTHNEVINGLCFARRGAERFEELKLDCDVRAVWMRYVDPGLPLAQQLQRVVEQYRSEHDLCAPNVVFMAKHGVLVAAESPKAVLALQERCQQAVASLVRRYVRREGATDPFGGRKVDVLAGEARSAALVRLAPMLRAQLADPKQCVHAFDSPTLAAFASSRKGKSFALRGALCPDQIVYCLPAPLWLEPPATGNDDALRGAVGETLEDFRARFAGRDPKIVLVPGLGCLAVGESVSRARDAAAIYESMVRSTAAAERLGGVIALTAREAAFIDSWSAEQYRRKIAAGRRGTERAGGLVVGVTGAGQGVGRELALHLAAEGASILAVDVNPETLQETADEIERRFGAGRVVGAVANVTAEAEMRGAVGLAVAEWGGLDVMVANAGILKSFKVTQFPAETWERIIQVNLVGVFVTMKVAAEVMVRQKSGNIIQINSKSGKIGSKYNSAYAASKFGGIGLVQSLALDLVEDNVRVNAICPGNFFDLPLWSAPGGLFDQYRKKFGNASREEVRRIYAAKIPLGRGCLVSDVVKTILYIIDQTYETGQAYNVTGGQELR